MIGALRGTRAAVLGEYLASPAIHLPDDLAARTRLLVLDSLGCGLHGSTLPWSRAIADTVAATEPAGPATVWGTGIRTSATQAVLANGSAVHAFELDDVGAFGHHGSTTVTVGLALAEAGAALSGPRFLSAVVSGIEVGARVGECLGTDVQTRSGFHLPSLVGAFAAAATASSVLRLSAEQATHALAIVAQLASGVMATQQGGMGKRLAAGHAAACGLRSAQLAQHGFTSTDAVLGSGHGSFPDAFHGGRADYDLDRLVDGLGSQYRSYGVAIKLWACRAPIHAALEAIVELRQAARLDPRDVERIAICLPRAAYQAIGARYDRASPATAQLNLRYCVAVLLVRGAVFIDEFEPVVLDAPDVLDLISRIDVEHDPSLDAAGAGFLAPATVNILLRSGRYLHATGRARTATDRPATADEVHAKFGKTARTAVSDQRCSQIASLCDRLTDLDDITELAGLLTATLDGFKERTKP